MLDQLITMITYIILFMMPWLVRLSFLWVITNIVTIQKTKNAYETQIRHIWVRWNPPSNDNKKHLKLYQPKSSIHRYSALKVTVLAPSTLVIVRKSVPRVWGDVGYARIAIHSFHLSLSRARTSAQRNHSRSCTLYFSSVYLSLSQP